MTAFELPAADAPAEEWCPSCGAPEIDSMTPRTVYACGSSTCDGRPGTFAQKCEPPTAEESGRLAVSLPAPDAPASEWGRLAVSIPGWRWPGPGTSELMDLRCIHMPEWEGYLLRLLGRKIAYLRYASWDPGMTQPMWQWYDRQPDDHGEHWSRSLPFYQAAISVAAAFGRWPGGGA